MFKGIVNGYEFFKTLYDIPSYIGVGPLVDCKSSSGMGIKKMTDPLSDSSLCNTFLHLARDVNKVHVQVGLNCERTVLH